MITPMPYRSHTGSTSRSIPRTSSEYGGCSHDEPLAAAPLGDPLRLDDLVAGNVDEPKSRTLPCAHEVGRARRASRRCRCPARAVDLVQVDPVGLRRRRLSSHLLHDPAARVAARFGSVAHRAVHLGREDDVVAAARERLADDLLRLAARVDVGGVDEVDAGVERAVDDADRLVVVGVAPAPNIIAPRHSGLTSMPVRPRFRAPIKAGRLLAAKGHAGPGRVGDERAALVGDAALDTSAIPLASAFIIILRRCHNAAGPNPAPR